MTHRMIRKAEYPSGAEEWQCQDCPERVVVQYDPAFKAVELVEGEPAGHSIGNGGLILEPPKESKWEKLWAEAGWK